jgi:hypothetical protein
MDGVAPVDRSAQGWSSAPRNGARRAQGRIAGEDDHVVEVAPVITAIEAQTGRAMGPQKRGPKPRE